jgi:hypothetical protein
LARPYTSRPQNLSKRQTKFLKERLQKLGLKSYREYITSNRWISTRDHYRASKALKTCVVCRDPNVELHHKTYQRLGRERLTDLVPLCQTHHDELHERSLDLWRGPALLLAERRGAGRLGAE